MAPRRPAPKLLRYDVRGCARRTRRSIPELFHSVLRLLVFIIIQYYLLNITLNNHFNLQ